MCTFTFYVVEKVGRRKGLLWGAALGCIPMLYIGGYVSKVSAKSPTTEHGQHADQFSYRTIQWLQQQLEPQNAVPQVTLPWSLYT
jgi:hypothetical protein